MSMRRIPYNTVLVKGIGACAGIAKGKVKIVNDLDDVAKMNEGDILVAPFTTPLLTSAMVKARAIITDTGGMTCHAAVIARELGVPCVVAAKNATKILEDEMVVIIDGEKGLVYRGDT